MIFIYIFAEKRKTMITYVERLNAKTQAEDYLKTIYRLLDKKPLSLHYTQMNVRADFGNYALNFALGDEPWYDTTACLSKEEISKIEHYLSFNDAICFEIKHLDRLLPYIKKIERIYYSNDLEEFTCYSEKNN